MNYYTFSIQLSAWLVCDLYDDSVVARFMTEQEAKEYCETAA